MGIAILIGISAKVNERPTLSQDKGNGREERKTFPLILKAKATNHVTIINKRHKPLFVKHFFQVFNKKILKPLPDRNSRKQSDLSPFFGNSSVNYGN